MLCMLTHFWNNHVEEFAMLRDPPIETLTILVGFEFVFARDKFIRMYR